MLFPHDELLAIRRSPPSTPEEFTRAASAFFGPTMGPDYHELFQQFLLDDLPPADEMTKIVSRLSGMAEARHAVLSDFCWWDIVSKQQSLVATFRRFGVSFTIAFFWKKTAKSTKPPIPEGHCSFNPDPYSINGKRLDVEGTTYQEMKLAFETWLTQSCPENN